MVTEKDVQAAAEQVNKYGREQREAQKAVKEALENYQEVHQHPCATSRMICEAEDKWRAVKIKLDEIETKYIKASRTYQDLTANYTAPQFR